MSIEYAFAVPHPPLIIPEVGRGEQHSIQQTIDAYETAGRQIAALAPETVVIVTPHSVLYSDYIHISPGDFAEGDLSRFGAPQVSLRKSYDTELVRAICEQAEAAGISAGTRGEKDKRLDHGALIPLYFIERYFSDYMVVRISLSGLSALEHYRFGKCIRQAVECIGRRVVLVASGDLSHKLTSEGPYGYAPEGPEFDTQLTQALREADFMRLLRFDEGFTEKAAECGLRSFIIMTGALDGRDVNAEMLSYEGPFGVGYAVFSFTAGNQNANRQFEKKYLEEERLKIEKMKHGEDAFVRLARESLETYVKTGHATRRPGVLPAELNDKRAGVFVSLKKHGQLRGCIGTISATEPSIADEIIRNAVSAGTDDPRFDPVTEGELPELVYSVDVLGDAEPVSSMESLDPKRYGVIVSHGYRRGLLLPNLEGIDTARQQVSIALKKAGISTEEKYSLERFEVVRHR